MDASNPRGAEFFEASAGGSASDLPPTLLPTIPASSPAMMWLRQTLADIAASEDLPSTTRDLARAVAAGDAPLTRLLADDALRASERETDLPEHPESRRETRAH